MVRISIICLIYKSIKLMDAVYESAMKYTPMLKEMAKPSLYLLQMTLQIVLLSIW